MFSHGSAIYHRHTGTRHSPSHPRGETIGGGETSVAAAMPIKRACSTSQPSRRATMVARPDTISLILPATIRYHPYILRCGVAPACEVISVLFVCPDSVSCCFAPGSLIAHQSVGLISSPNVIYWYLHWFIILFFGRRRILKLCEGNASTSACTNNALELRLCLC
jgi:hypothetical protein